MKDHHNVCLGNVSPSFDDDDGSGRHFNGSLKTTERRVSFPGTTVSVCFTMAQLELCVVTDGDDGNLQLCLSFVVHLRQQEVNLPACISLICAGVD